MLTHGEQRVVDALRKARIATMQSLRNRFQLSHMTVFRALRKYGYFHSYNYNASYYVLHDVPQFDDWGLWAYRDVRFSRYGSLPETLATLVEKAPAGQTVPELEERLQVPVANLLSRLVHEGRLQSQTLHGRRVIYLVADPEVAAAQKRQREGLVLSAAPSAVQLPPEMAASEVIEVLREKILSPQFTPDQLARRLRDRRVSLTAGQVRQVFDFYALEKKRHRWRSPS
jgi:hypothetical protein